MGFRFSVFDLRFRGIPKLETHSLIAHHLGTAEEAAPARRGDDSGETVDGLYIAAAFGVDLFGLLGLACSYGLGVVVLGLRSRIWIWDLGSWLFRSRLRGRSIPLQQDFGVFHAISE